MKRTRVYSMSVHADRVSVAIVAAVVFVIGMVACAISCGGATQTLKTWSGAFAGCEKEDLGQLVQSGEIQATLLDDVAALIQGNAASLESDLTKLAGAVGVEAVHCAILAVESSLAPNVGSATSRALPQGLVRAKAWAAQAQAQKGSAK